MSVSEGRVRVQGRSNDAGGPNDESGPSLHRTDLAGVVSTYIGETEKNLQRLVGAADRSGVTRFFDEADALFGKRAEVKDAHDRYAAGADARALTPPKIDASAIEELLREALERIPAYTPEWTDREDSDPGVTLLHLLAFAAGTIGYWAAVRWAIGRTGLRSRTTTVTVRGEPWRQIDKLEHAGPDDAVYRLDPVTGAVEFGSGDHGKKPDGSVTIMTRYRYGAGAVGAVVAAGAVWTAGTWCLFKRTTRRPNRCAG